jgi:hypothetical protein
VYKSIHFDTTVGQLAMKINNGFSPIIREEEAKIIFKRHHDKNEKTDRPTSELSSDTGKDVQTSHSELYSLIPGVIEKLEVAGRLADFESTMKAVTDGILEDNIAFHLLLDIGQFYSCSTVSNMRYSEETLQFWSTVKNLFKGKGIHFFRGYKSQGMKEDAPARPSDCKINFIVPSDSILSKESAIYIGDAKEPGILRTSLESFSRENPGKDVKLSIDGKKLASGLGVLGDENLCGYEMAPTLTDRKAKLASEVDIVGSMQTLVDERSIDGCETLSEIEDTMNMKQALLLTISNLSTRVRELRELVVKKNIALNNLLKQVEGDWKESKVAPAISFCKTKIVHSNKTIKDLLQSVDNLAYLVACLNGTDRNYVHGHQTKVYFDQQQNYVCLKDAKPPLTTTDPQFTKQRTQAWFDLREGSRVTGSTMFKALGLGLLKEQQQHYDKVIKGKQSSVSPELQALFDYGTTQEINALATLLGKIIPVYYPALVFHEDGCEVMSMGDTYAVISGDGSGVDDSKNVQVAFEFKCPRPGKSRTTDVHYTLPVYYTTQVMSQMAVKTCSSFGYVCYNPEGATYITGKQDISLWEELFGIANELYGATEVPRPKRNQPYQQELKDKLKEYAKTCTFVAEFPSLIGVPCSCEPTDDKLDMHGYHLSRSDEVRSYGVNDQSLKTVATMIESSTSALKEAYEILRRAAKEILVSVISDLDRTITSNDISFHAVPVHYAMSGYSLPMSPVRCLLTDIFHEISNKNMHLRVIAFDGQFLELAVAEECGRPLTICRFMKYFWMSVQKMEKSRKLATLLLANHLPSMQGEDDLARHFDVKREGSILHVASKSGMKTVLSPGNIAKAIEAKCKSKSKKHNPDDDSPPEEQSRPSSDIMAYLPQDVVDQLDEETIAVLRNVTENASSPDFAPEPHDEIAVNDDLNTQQLGHTDFEVLLITLIASTEDSKWKEISMEDFRSLFENSTSIQTAFVVSELKTIASVTQDLQVYNKMRKTELVNLVSTLHGDGSAVDRMQSPKSLKVLSTNAVRRWPVDGVNVAYAQFQFPDALQTWEEENDFKGEWIVQVSGGSAYTIQRWYAQPAHIDGHAIQTIIDPHHIFVNNRCRCCSKGMSGMQIRSEAWWSVAEKSSTNGTGLSPEIAKDIRDRQRNSFAQTTFSEKVEVELERNGDIHEARWCHLLRNLYRSIDEAAIDTDQRIEWMLEIRDYLMDFLRVGHFPPPGGFVAGLPMAQYEGILTNVDIRLQLYSMTSQGSYNQRAVTSLDSETFFSAFQVRI